MFDMIKHHNGVEAHGLLQIGNLQRLTLEEVAHPFRRPPFFALTVQINGSHSVAVRRTLGPIQTEISLLAHAEHMREVGNVTFNPNSQQLVTNGQAKKVGLYIEQDIIFLNGIFDLPLDQLEVVVARRLDDDPNQVYFGVRQGLSDQPLLEPELATIY